MDNTHKLILRIAEAIGLEVEEMPIRFQDTDPITRGTYEGHEIIDMDYKVTKKGKIIFITEEEAALRKQWITWLCPLLHHSR